MSIQHIEKRHLSTNEAAEKLGMRPATLRHGLCLKGHYLGMQPVKLPNGRLVWPAKAIENMLTGSARSETGKVS